MARVLITGGAGFIGSHLVDAMVEDGHDVLAVDNLTPQVHPEKPDYLNPKAEYRFQDLREKGVIEDAFRGADIVYHLAAAVGVGQSMYRIADYVDANTATTAQILQHLVDDSPDLERFVVASSMSLYGEGAYECPDDRVVQPKLRDEEQLQQHEWELRCPECKRPVRPVPTSESKPLDPTSIYAVTKRDQEEMALLIGRAYAIPTVALRFFNVYGPRQALSNPYTGVAAIFQSRIQNNHPPLVFEDGNQTRDFVSVRDIVEGCRLAGERANATGYAMNVGTGRATSVLDVAEILLKIYGSDLTPRVENTYRAGDIRHCYADISRANELLGYEPKVSLEDGLRDFVAWSRHQRPEDHVEEAHRELVERGLVER